MIASLIGFAAILVLAFMRMPLGFALGLVGAVGFAELSSYRAAISNAGRLVIDAGQNYGLSVLPMFILMGLLVERGGMAKELYRAAYVFLGIGAAALPCPLLWLAVFFPRFAARLLPPQRPCQKYPCRKCAAIIS